MTLRHLDVAMILVQKIKGLGLMARKWVAMGCTVWMVVIWLLYDYCWQAYKCTQINGFVGSFSSGCIDKISVLVTVSNVIHSYSLDTR